MHSRMEDDYKPIATQVDLNSVLNEDVPVFMKQTPIIPNNDLNRDLNTPEIHDDQSPLANGQSLPLDCEVDDLDDPDENYKEALEDNHADDLDNMIAQDIVSKTIQDIENNHIENHSTINHENTSESNQLAEKQTNNNDEPIAMSTIEQELANRGEPDRIVVRGDEVEIIEDHTTKDMEIEMDDQNQDSEKDYEYIVEKVMDKMIDDKGHVKYLVKWEGYGAQHNTWEPVDNLKDCDRAIEKFEIEQTQKVMTRVASKGPHKGGHKGRITEYQVDEILGLTRIGDDRYFLISLTEGRPPSFIRTSIANSLFPRKVIDFYVRHINWKE